MIAFYTRIRICFCRCGQLSCLVWVCGLEQRCISLWLHLFLHMCTLECEGCSSAAADCWMRNFNSDFRTQQKMKSIFQDLSPISQFNEKLILSGSLRAWIHWNVASWSIEFPMYWFVTWKVAVREVIISSVARAASHINSVVVFAVMIHNKWLCYDGCSFRWVKFPIKHCCLLMRTYCLETIMSWI